MDEKIYIRPDDLLRDSFLLARLIYRSGFHPQVLLVLWRGGTPVGIAVHEFLLYKGIAADHTVVKAESYTGVEQRIEPRIESLEPLLARLSPDSRVLVIDDIFDTGCTLSAVCAALRTKTPHVRTATLYARQGHSRTALRPDYCLRETDRWVVFPHELAGLTPEEILRKHPPLAEILCE